jgi:NAD(P)-dependent dehydrogenase (short-subunit alcohol dehydrogenase family)
MRLTGAVALVTGGSSGIGAATARALAGAGARVLIAGRDPARLRDIAGQTGGIPLVCDLAAAGGPASLAAAAERAAGTLPAVPGADGATAGIDILVNNAGLGWAGPIGEITAEKVAELVAVNLTAPMQLTRLLAPAMIVRGRGRVVFVSSIAGATGVRGEAVYSATKAGLAAFAESLAYELDGRDVRVSVIVPGVIDTPFFDRRGHAYGRKTPGPQPPERVAQAVMSCLERDRYLAYVPRWLRFPAWLHGAAPGTFRVLAGRFGDPG